MGNEKINISITWVVRVLWMLSFVLLLFIKNFSSTWKWSYIGFIILLTIVTIFRIKESQKIWYQESDNDD
ncbi:MAG TPA: hypothetical protein QGH56_01785 [Candidatus Marinimicrobia bacterium]|nr:hypothetical protein [Candidatus Neomarinimicrobiota bacterium]